MRVSAIVFLATCSSVAAFAPSASQSSSSTQLQAENVGRREAFGAFGAALGAAILFPEASNALENPALQTFKGRRPTKGQFIPGKGLHANEEYDRLMAANNPALQTFKGAKPTKGQFIPGKGLHSNIEFDNLIALENPALKTLKGRRKTKGQFIPGKGLHSSNTFDELLG